MEVNQHLTDWLVFYNFTKPPQALKYLTPGDSYIIEKYGKTAAAVVPVKVYENWKRQRQQLFDLIRKIQEANKDADPDEVMQRAHEAQQAVRSSPS